MNPEGLAALRLMRSENIGVKTFFALIKLFGTPEKALEMVPGLTLRGGAARSAIKLCSEEQALKEIDSVSSYGAQMIYFKDASYPPLLKQIVDYPPIITVLGNKALLKKRTVAIVGSRNASSNGTRFAYKIALDLGESNFIVSSGLARGIDTYAHRASLDKGTIAVIAGGIDNIYPPENKDLYAQIAEKGLIITENSFGSLPKAQHFPQRNRIISGLAEAVIIVEASLKSGSLITANFAIEHNRELFAVPGFPLDPRYSGTNLLLKQGAHLFETSNDVLQVLEGQIANKVPKQQLLLDEREEFISENIDYDSVNYKKDLEKIRKLLLSKLNATPISIDYLVRELQVPVNFIMMVVVELELAGKIERVSGNSIALAAA